MSSRDDFRFPPLEGEPRPPISERPGAPPSSEPPEVARSRLWWLLNLVLFAGTVYSVFDAGKYMTAPDVPGFRGWVAGWPFALPLLAILLCHEFGHYIAARIHRVPASLPYFIPLPKLSPFGTFGAVIVMRQRIRSANALLDIGASGPLAGMVVAIPMMLVGLSLSNLGPRGTENFVQEGQSILYWLLKRVVFGRIAPDHDVFLHPTALAAWAGFLVTFLNLIPFGQLDGGHVAYALLGERQNRIARWVAYFPFLLILYNAWVYVRPIALRGLHQGFHNLPENAWLPVSAATMWIGFFVLLTILRAVSGGAHPPVDHPELTPARRAVAIGTWVLFVLIFMPTPWTLY
jgi:membrane-associated protease RseP (regulator of RpoE activity)